MIVELQKQIESFEQLQSGVENAFNSAPQWPAEQEAIVRKLVVTAQHRYADAVEACAKEIGEAMVLLRSAEAEVQPR